MFSAEGSGTYIFVAYHKSMSKIPFDTVCRDGPIPFGWGANTISDIYSSGRAAGGSPGESYWVYGPYPRSGRAVARMTDNRPAYAPLKRKFLNFEKDLGGTGT